jgi:hypothetical protein
MKEVGIVDTYTLSRYEHRVPCANLGEFWMVFRGLAHKDDLFFIAVSFLSA